MNTETNPYSFGPSIRVGDLAPGETLVQRVDPDAATRATIADALGIDGVRKLRFVATLSPLGKRDWRLSGELGATVVQACVVTLAPVVTRIDETLERSYIAGFELPEGDEVEISDEVDQDPLGTEIDLGAVMVEALALALPAYPRAPDADLGDAVFTEPGKEALTDEAAKPFAGLAALRDQLDDGDS